MGQIRFVFQDERLATQRVISSIHMVGFDGSIWPCKAQLVEKKPLVASDAETVVLDRNHELIVSRNESQSGRIFLLFPFESLGEIVVGTGTIVERDAPYRLDVELARGTLNRLRNQASNWHEGGLEITDKFSQRIDQAQQFLASAIYDKSNQGAALECLEITTGIIQDLAADFGRQVSDFRKQHQTRRKILFGVDGDTANEAVYAKQLPRINTVIAGGGLSCQCHSPTEETTLSEPWLQTSVLNRRRDQFQIIGPLVNMRPNGLPDWIQSMDHIEQRRSAILDVIEKTCDQMSEKSCDLVHAVSGINGVGHRHLSFSQQLHVTIDILQKIESYDSGLPVMVSFDQPWGERIAWSVGGGHSLQIADTLLRQGCRIDALGLELNLDYWPNGSLPREATQWTELLDFWSHFGLPLFIFLRVPFGEGASPDRFDDRLPKQQGPLGSMTRNQRAEFIKSTLPLLFARPNIQSVIWRHTDENESFVQCQPDWSIAETADQDDPISEAIRETLNRWEI